MADRIAIARVWTEGISAPNKAHIAAVGAVLAQDVSTINPLGTTVGRTAVLEAFGKSALASAFKAGAWSEASAEGATVSAVCMFPSDAPVLGATVKVTVGDDGYIYRVETTLIEAPAASAQPSGEGSREERALLRRYLRNVQESLLWKLEGLSDEELRQPMTKSLTNLIGIVKHLAQVTYDLCGAFGREHETLPWDSHEDVYATPDESCDEIIAIYRRACAAGLKLLDDLDLDTTFKHSSGVTVSLRFMAYIVLLDTYRHTGHGDVVREMIDGRVGARPDDPMSVQDYDEDWLRMRRARMSGDIDRDEWVAYVKSRSRAPRKESAATKPAGTTKRSRTSTKPSATKTADAKSSVARTTGGASPKTK